MFDDVQNWFKQLLSGKSTALLSGNTKIPDKGNFVSKFDKIKDSVVIVQEVKIEEPIEEQILPQSKKIEEKEDIINNNVNLDNSIKSPDQICNNCGNKFNPGDLFCMNCGTKLM